MLESQKPFVRQTLGRNVRLKYTPSISFYLDETMDTAMNLEQLFRKIHKEDEPPTDKQ
jgi:ribosome-binding factor A